jgi:hypothetical protein
LPGGPSEPLNWPTSPHEVTGCVKFDQLGRRTDGPDRLVASDGHGASRLAVDLNGNGPCGPRLYPAGSNMQRTNLTERRLPLPVGSSETDGIHEDASSAEDCAWDCPPWHPTHISDVRRRHPRHRGQLLHAFVRDRWQQPAERSVAVAPQALARVQMNNAYPVAHCKAPCPASYRLAV